MLVVVSGIEQKWEGVGTVQDFDHLGAARGRLLNRASGSDALDVRTKEASYLDHSCSMVRTPQPVRAIQFL